MHKFAPVTNNTGPVMVVANVTIMGMTAVNDTACFTGDIDKTRNVDQCPTSWPPCQI